MRLRAGWLIPLALFTTGFVQQSTSSGTPIAWGDACPLMEIGRLAVPGPDAEELREVFSTAVEAWQSDGCDQLPFAVVDGTFDYDATGLDGRNMLVTRGPEFCQDPANADDELCLSPGTLAVTSIYSWDRPGDPRDGQLVEIDMEINLRFQYATDGAANKYDLLSAVTHELGHVLGLEHSCTTERGAKMFDPAGHAVPACSGDSEDVAVGTETMYPWFSPGETARREPQSDERRAICTLYRKHPGTCSNFGALTTSCACNLTERAASGQLMIGLGAVALLLGRRRRAAG